MRKISRISYFRMMICILMFMPLMLKGQTVSPRSGSTIQQLSEINITFSSDVVLQNIDGISIGLGTSYLPPWDKPGEYGFSVTTQGNQATIKLDNPYSNLYNFEQWGTLFCEEGTFLVGGSPSSVIGAEWTFSPSTATIPEPVVSPARGSVNLSLSEITIEWPGCGVEIVGNEWDLEEVKFGVQGSNFSHANIASIETAGDAGSLGKSKVVIKVQNSKDGNKPFTAKGTYVLNLEQGIVKINAADGSAMFPGDEFTFFISDYMVSPKNMSKITSFDGLTIGGGNIEIKDPSLIKLYRGYYDGMGESVPPADLSPLASGTNVTETTLDGVPAMNVSFGLNEPLYNGAYSIYIPENAILSDGKGINEGNSLYVTFTIEGNMKPLPEWTAEPAPGKVTSLSTVNVAWGKRRPASNALENFYGDFLTLTNDAGYVPVTLQLPNGTKNQLMGLVRMVTDNNEDVDQAERLGAYLYIMLGNSYSADGVYTLTIPAGSLTVDVDNHNHVPVENTVITYTIGDKPEPDVQLPEPTVNPANNSKLDKLENVTLSWNGYEVHQIGDGEGGMLKDITYTVNGGSPKVIDVTYEGNEAPGMEGYYSTIVLPINATESGKYVVTVPAGALYVASENAGSLENEEIVLTYDVTVTETPAPVYMTGGSVDPRDGSHLANMGDVYITWGNYTLDITPEPNKDYVNLPLDKVTATLNGEKVNLNNMFGVIFRAINTQGSDEGTGGTSTFHVAEIQFYPGDLCFGWSGTLNLKFEEGLVKSTTGAISPAFDLTYYLGGQQVVSPAIFTPEEGSKFLPGEAVVYAEWEGYNVTSINGGVTLNTMNEEGEVGSSTSISNSQLSIEGGKLKIDLTSLPAGSYQMWLHQGAVNLGDNAVNADAPYAFSIALPEPEGPEATDIDPAINLADGKITISWDGNEIEQTNDFNLTIIDNTTGEEVNIWDGVVYVDENGNLVIDLEELELGDGDYTLTLAEGSVNIDEDGTITYNNEVTYDFKTSGIDMFIADDTGSWRVFNLNGVNVLNTDDATYLNRLDPGIYIINGMKYVVK